MDAITIPRQITFDVDGAQIGRGDWVECINASGMGGDCKTGGRYLVAGVLRDCNAVCVTDEVGYIRSVYASRFRKLAPTPLDKREDT